MYLLVQCRRRCGPLSHITDLSPLQACLRLSAATESAWRYTFLWEEEEKESSSPEIAQQRKIANLYFLTEKMKKMMTDPPSKV